jgi:hypothetical protein
MIAPPNQFPEQPSHGTIHRDAATGKSLKMFGILDILVLILVRRRHCSRCGRTFWAAPPHLGRDTAVGREYYLCVCGNRYETGRREWEHLSRDEKRVYLWSGLLAIPILLTTFAAIGGYFLRARAVLDDVGLSWSSRFVKRSDMFGVFADHKGTTCPSVLKAD